MYNDRPILLVEDNPDDEALTLRAFSKTGVKNPVVVARDGVEAVAALFGKEGKPASQRPVLVLLDLKLPRVDGMEVLRRIRADEHTTLTPVVILTTSNEPRDIQQAYQLGANGYVRKPIDYQAFVESIDVIVKYWLGLNEPAERSL